MDKLILYRTKKRYLITGLLCTIIIWPIIDSGWNEYNNWYHFIYAAPIFASEFILRWLYPGLIFNILILVWINRLGLSLCTISLLWPLVILSLKPVMWENKRWRIAMIACWSSGLNCTLVTLDCFAICCDWKARARWRQVRLPAQFSRTWHCWKC